MNLKKLVSIGLCIFVIVSILPISFVRAAGVSVTLGTASMAISTAYNSTVSFVPGTALSTGATVTLYYPSAYTDTSLVLGDVTLTKTGDANFTSAVTVVSTGSDTATFTLTTSAPTDTSNPFIITFANSHLLTSGTGANYTFAVTTDNLAGGGDYGAALQYVGNTNQVKVTAIVKPILTFAIRNTADSAEQATVSGLKTCALGVLTTTTVSTCDYRLKVGTNSVSGYTISYISDTNLTNGTYNMTNALAGSNGSSPASAGTEQYGVLLTAGSNTVYWYERPWPYGDLFIANVNTGKLEIVRHLVEKGEISGIPANTTINGFGDINEKGEMSVNLYQDGETFLTGKLIPVK